MVTGPNMGGKSSTVRMVALLCIMGQVSVVKADRSGCIRRKGCERDGQQTQLLNETFGMGEFQIASPLKGRWVPSFALDALFIFSELCMLLQMRKIDNLEVHPFV